MPQYLNLRFLFIFTGPPKWLREPVDTSTSVGESVTLPCATFGYPPPDVTWRKANGNVSSDSFNYTDQNLRCNTIF